MQAWAQWQWVPAGVPGVQEASAAQRTAVIRTTLPLFDDFSQRRGEVDTLRWEAKGGAFVNNTFGIRTPSQGMATLDGTDYLGNPYNSADPLANGLADKLTSRPIDLSGLSVADSLILTFYWQAGGIGERPDRSDTLYLQAKDRNGNWQTLWRQHGDVSDEFRTARLALNASAFFHTDFQFRFQNFGRLSGGLDTWNIDYVYFFRKSADAPRQRLDIALSGTPTSPFGRYTAVPLNHFAANRAMFTADTVFGQVQHLADTFNVYSHRTELRNAQTGQLLASPQTGSRGRALSYSGTNLIFSFERMQLMAIKPLPDGLVLSPDSMALQVRFIINSNETNQLIPTRANDTIQAVFHLNNYLAYDDGTAEYGVGLTQRFGKMAMRHVTAIPDQLTHIDICFPRLGQDMAGQSFNLCIWEHIDTADGARDRVLLRQNVAFINPTSRDQFRRIPLSRPIQVQGTFFVGIEQLINDLMPVGYDLNTTNGDQIFFNVGVRWQKNDLLTGSLMIRPVYRRSNVTGTAEDARALSWRAFPNPAREALEVQGQELRLACLYDLQGIEVRRVPADTPEGLRMDLKGLAAGIYLLRVVNTYGAATQKIIIE